MTNDVFGPFYPIQTETLERPIAFVGATGSGKTTAAKGAVEQLLGLGRRVCIIDPTGVWWGLRRGFDGSPGFPVVIFGGDHADVPIGETAGARLGGLVASGEVRAAIVDTSDFSSAEAIRFLTPFFGALHKGLRGPLHLVVDEADSVAPQNPLPETRRLLGIVDKIARQGRVKGFRPLWITQRPAVLNKNVLSQVATLVAMRLGAPQDRKALDAWIQGNADANAARGVLKQLPGLPVGTGFVWSPAEGRLDCVAFPPAETADTSRAPEDGEVPAEPMSLADVDLGALRTALEAAPTEEPQPYMRATRAARESAEQRGYDRGHAAGVAEGRRLAAAETASRTRSIATQLRSLAADLDRDAGVPGDPAEVERLAVASQTTQPSTPHPRLKRPVGSGPKTETSGRVAGRPAKAPSHEPLPPTAAAMLAVLDTAPPLWRTWAEIGLLAGVRSRGGHFNALRKALLASGLVDVDGDRVRIAIPRAGAPPPIVDPAALVELWAGKLEGAAPRILRQLSQVGPLSRASVAEDLGLQPRGGHWNAAWKQLRIDNLVLVENDVARLTPLLQRGQRS